MNGLGAKRIPFFFAIDYEKKAPLIFSFNSIPEEICYKSKNYSIGRSSAIQEQPFYLKKYPISLEDYSKGFDIVQHHLKYGNSFLINYTASTPIRTNYTLEQIYALTSARFKLLIKGRLVVFSPEAFVQIKNGTISTYPMKGTIDASIPNASRIILEDEKELAEHYTIVDLLRNDLSQVSKSVKVNRFRYIEEVISPHKNLLQISSEIAGQLESNYHEHLGDIFDKLLPAGSISGAPKQKTIEVIKEAEDHDRELYTGIFGIFDGYNVESAVAIRFIQQTDSGLIYKSGGGITYKSDVRAEYQEMIDKVYVPIHRKHQNIKWQNLQHPSAQLSM